MANRLIDDTARKLGLTPEGLLRKYAESVTRTNQTETYELRLRQVRAGYVAEPLEKWCLTHWRKNGATHQLATAS